MPTTVVETEVIKDAVSSACRAPSLHNSQPWQWLFNRGQLRLFLDPSRVTNTDQFAREALISCGAALDHLRVAMAATGWHAKVDRFPDPNNPNHLASLILPDGLCDGPRSTSRQRHLDASHRPAAVQPTNRTAIPRTSGGQHGRPSKRARGHPPRRFASATRGGSADCRVARFYNPVYNDELHWWTAPIEASEGIPYSALVSAAEGDRVGVDQGSPSPISPKDAPRSRRPRQNPAALHRRPQSRRRVGFRRGALSGLAGMHDGRSRHLPGNAPHRGRRHPRTHPVAHGP